MNPDQKIQLQKTQSRRPIPKRSTSSGSRSLDKKPAVTDLDLAAPVIVPKDSPDQVKSDPVKLEKPEAKSDAKVDPKKLGRGITTLANIICGITGRSELTTDQESELAESFADVAEQDLAWLSPKWVARGNAVVAILGVVLDKVTEKPDPRLPRKEGIRKNDVSGAHDPIVQSTAHTGSNGGVQPGADLPGRGSIREELAKVQEGSV